MPFEKPYKYDKDQILKAIEGSMGIKLIACKILDCTRKTFDKYLKRFAWARDAFDLAKDSTDDFVESKLLDKISEGNVAAIIFYCKTRLQKRGYVEKMQIEPVSDGGPRTVRDDVPDSAPPSLPELAGDVIDAEFSEDSGGE